MRLGRRSLLFLYYSHVSQKRGHGWGAPGGAAGWSDGRGGRERGKGQCWTLSWGLHGKGRAGQYVRTGSWDHFGGLMSRADGGSSWVFGAGQTSSGSRTGAVHVEGPLLGWLGSGWWSLFSQEGFPTCQIPRYVQNDCIHFKKYVYI